MNLNECEWTPNDDGFYMTACRNAFTFTEGTPEDNQFTYCPYCGCKIKEQAK